LTFLLPAMPALVQEVIGGWTARQIHDTVAAIARQPAYAIPVRQSLFGRALRWLISRIVDILDGLGGSRDARLVVIAALIVIVVTVVARMVVAQRANFRRRTGTSLRAIGSARRDYWVVADELAAANNFAGGCHAVYLAVLDMLGRSGALTLHASKTPGDYARELRLRRSGAAAAFRAFARQFETAVYGPTQPVAATYQALRESAERVIGSRAAA
jgi:hypothetical protein